MTSVGQQLLQQLLDSKPCRQLTAGFRQGLNQQLVYGLTGSQQSFFLAAWAQTANRPMTVVTHDEGSAKEVIQEMISLLPDREIMFLPKKDLVQATAFDAGNQIAAERIKVLASILANPRMVLVTTVENLGQKVLSAKNFASGFIHLQVGNRVSFEELTLKLVQLGYERAEQVEVAGQFAFRGGILDCFPLQAERPFRIEFFDDEIDSVRVFDQETQRSLEKMKECWISPALEYFFADKEKISQLSTKVTAEFERQLEKLRQQSNEQPLANYLQSFSQLVEGLEKGMFHRKLEQSFSLCPDQLTSLLDFFPHKPLVLVLEPSRCRESLTEYLSFRQETVWQMFTTGNNLLKEDETFLAEADIFKQFEQHKTVFMALLPRKGGKINPQQAVSFSGNLMHNFHGNLELLQKELSLYKSECYQVAFLATGKGGMEQLRELVVKPDLPALVFEGQLAKGFVIHEAKLVVITDEDIFGQQKKKKVKIKSGDKISSFVELKQGDYVVHENHGIGKYLGIEQLAIGEVVKDYLVVKYAGEDKLFVPTEQVDSIQRYIGVEGQAPKLYRLGGNDWHRVKARVKESVQELAKELLELYARREAIAGYSYSPDTVWQQNFESAFPYVETEDQLRAITEVKRDLERTRSMDRLLCGDVGYGKTEVALRAAFKVLMDGKQVAVLVPTTILAQQHYETFTQRFKDYPIKVEMLSRFRKPKQIKETISQLKTGEVDLVIGTHRLISADVKFKDVGLLVVDEEQRFGVAHKEKIKKLKANVDVLTLSATPIPRTLHMAMVGMRDLSVIETPPEDRYPVQTYVVEENLHVIKEAILRELSRGGQVFYLYNRVADIEEVARDLQKLVPHCRIGVTHGQMREDQLEDVMLKFINKQIDMLVCTTIIENGLDIPNVNTIIISEADKLGLSQLYQLRGRVGRSNRLAYAYFTYKKGKVLTEVAEKRLEAIREFTHLGAGFKIAMRDMEIRGSGNILGPEQHGNMMSVGFDLYCRLLEQAVAELEGKQDERKEYPGIELDISAYLKDSYIRDNATKISIYKKLLAVESDEELLEITEELIDRFGNLPQEAQNLLDITRLRVQAYQLGISKVKQERDKITIYFNSDPGYTGEGLLSLTKGMGRRISFNSSGPLEIRIKVTNITVDKRLSLINEIFGRIIALASGMNN
ncbi:MAG: transcription-repair coupling factor [Clostridia bacterium]|nr:transcription-repair coupling factor [Clostridia bacterium]